MGAIGGMGRVETQRSVKALGDSFFLEELLDSPMQVLSKGTLQKVFIEKVNRLREEGVTVLMAAHERKLVRAVAEKVYRIKNGILEACAPEEKKIYSVILENKGGAPLAEGMMRYGCFYRLKLEEEKCDALLPGLFAQGWRLRGMEYEEND